MENNKVTWKEQLAAIMMIVSLGYWFRMGSAGQIRSSMTGRS